LAVLCNYSNNKANQRVAITNLDGSRWAYGYDSLGQVTSGRKYWSDSSLVLGQQFDYVFDHIGNRKTAVSGGDANGNRKRTQVYSANNLNQYTQRTVPDYLDIIGTATNTAIVTVNSGNTSRKNDYYRAELSVANSSSAVWQSITNTAVLASGTNDYVTNSIGNQFLPKSTETFGYDADGNQTNDGRWTLIWDGENRLVQIQSLSGAPVGSSNRLTFVYDQHGRRIARTSESFVSGAWSITLSNRFVYDGWNLLAELNATNNAVINSFVWGLDLSGTMQGAGGVGGLLAITTTNAGSHFVGFDGNGNVAVLVSASSGIATANYEYDPFGNVLRATGPMALLNPFRFSTKYTDGESAFNYYGYRFYNPLAGRWVSRDPIEEKGGNSIYGFAHNNPLSKVDVFGLGIFTECCNGRIFNKITECCKKGMVYRKGKRPTGIVFGNAPPMLPGLGDHVWLQWSDSSKPSGLNSAGYNSPSSPGVWKSPDSFEQADPPPPVKLYQIELDPCKYDVFRFYFCVISTATAPPTFTTANCKTYKDKIIDTCKTAHKL
jgi:RHS repeat-associated protein